MWGTEIASSDGLPLSVVPCFLKGGDNAGERAASVIAKKSGGIFRHKESWAESRNNSQTLAPHPSLIRFAFLLAGHAHRLAGNPGAYQIDFPIVAFVWRECLNLAPPRNVGPMLCQNRRGVCVTLHLPLAGHAGTFEAEIKAANPCEERAEGHGHPFHARNVARASSESTPV
jgi:hypothetical protein